MTSNSNRRIVDTNLAAIGLSDISISLDDVCEGKPDPFPYRTSCFRLGLHPSEVLAVEDSATGVASARGAGMPVAFLGRLLRQAQERAHVIAALPDILELLAEPMSERASASC